MASFRVNRTFVRLLAALALWLLSAPALAAEPLAPKDVPEPLKPWVSWALDGHEGASCTAMVGTGARVCAWPARLDLVLDDKGGTFTQRWHLDAKSFVPLPGDSRRWPLDVRDGAVRAVVVTRGGAPSVELAPGDHVITGRMAWDAMPESIKVPPETGLLSLTLRGVRVPEPKRDDAGTLWLQRAAKGEEGDALELVVHRRVDDDVPLMLTTRVELHVAGKNREELLGIALPVGFVPMALEGELPVRFEPDGRLRVQVRPGVFTLTLTARSSGPVGELARPEPKGPWRRGDEVWVFAARNDVRVVSIEGVSSIDPAQTTLPDAWKALPAYPMKLGDTLRFVERRRGDSDPPPDQLHLRRTFWLDFDGTGYTVQDTLTGTLRRSSRLTMAAPTVLGRVGINGKDQLITHLGDVQHTGVEVRQGQLNVQADSRIPGHVRTIPAVSWEHDFHSVSGDLRLPPGWRLVHATGVDDVPGTWLRHWTLLELFVALITSLAVFRLHGARWGALMLVTLALTLPEDGAPRWAWLVVLALEALVRVIPEGRVRRGFAFARGASVVAVALFALVFAIEHVRGGMYPSLAAPAHGATRGDLGGLMREAEMAPPPAAAVATAGGEPTAPEPLAEPSHDGKEGEADEETTTAAGDGRRQVAQKKLKSEAPKPAAPSSVTRAPRGSAQAGKLDAVKSLDRWSRSDGPEYRQSNAEVYDPNAMVQTGPGLPRWSWTALPLQWSGPVAQSQQLALLLLSPAQNLVLAFVRAALLLLMILRMMPWTARMLPSGLARAAASALVVAIALAPRAAQADTPPREVLDELRARLLRQPTCAPGCAELSRMAIEATGATMRLRLEVDAAADAAVPLPGTRSQVDALDVTVDGQPAKALSRDGSGALFVALPRGTHQVALTVAMPDRETVQLALPLRPHRVEVLAREGWAIEGVHEDGLADDTLQFTRVRAKASDASGSLEAGTLPPFVRVERTLRVGLNWQVETRVVRATPTGSAIVLEVPLLPGESVTTADVRVVSGRALVNMGATASEISWQSVLEQRSPVVLTAPKAVSWTEVWRSDVSPIWHASYEGFPAVHTQESGGARIPEWRPWPGEALTVAVTRPDGVPGQTLTIDESRLDLRPGLRATDAVLTLSIRASRGGEHTLHLPDGAALESVAINGATQPIRQEGRRVTVPVVPGQQSVVLSWREGRGITTMFRVSAVDLGTASVNANVELTVPSARWVLLAGGPRLGPAVLFWSFLFVLAVVSFLLGKVTLTPLRGPQWLLLAVGLSQAHVALAALFAGWLLVLGWRARSADVPKDTTLFNLRQLVLVAWTAVALVVFVVAVYHGLLGAPDMQIAGNGSTGAALRWYADRSDPQLPIPWMVSVPLLAYRAAMLAWALWIAIALLKWLRWGWAAFTAGGGWRSSPPRMAMATAGFAQATASDPSAAPPAPSVDEAASAEATREEPSEPKGDEP